MDKGANQNPLSAEVCVEFETLSTEAATSGGNPKLQIQILPRKSQIQIIQPKNHQYWDLGFGSIPWDLGFGIWDLRIKVKSI
jgi:hypothetical protein